MFPLVTLITKRLSLVKLSLDFQGWLSFATQAASSEKKGKGKKEGKGRCITKKSEVSGSQFNYVFPV